MARVKQGALSWTLVLFIVALGALVAGIFAFNPFSLYKEKIDDNTGLFPFDNLDPVEPGEYNEERIPEGVLFTIRSVPRDEGSGGKFIEKGAIGEGWDLYSREATFFPSWLVGEGNKIVHVDNKPLAEILASEEARGSLFAAGKTYIHIPQEEFVWFVDNGNTKLDEGEAIDTDELASFIIAVVYQEEVA